MGRGSSGGGKRRTQKAGGGGGTVMPPGTYNRKMASGLASGPLSPRPRYSEIATKATREAAATLLRQKEPKLTPAKAMRRVEANMKKSGMEQGIRHESHLWLRVK